MSTELPFAVVLNPLAGRGLAAREWPRLEGELRSRGLPFELLTTGSAAEAVARLQHLPPGQPVMAVGGDGTVGALLSELVTTGRPLAIVPLGSGNDYAGMLGLKPGDFTSALSRLRFLPRQVDAFEVQVVRGEQQGLRRILLNGMGMGFDAEVNDAMLRAPAQLSGFMRYAWGAVVSIRDLQVSDVEVVVDAQPLYAGPSALCAVMNSTRYGGGFLISPRSDGQDGLLNVVCSGALSRRNLPGLMLSVLRGRHLTSTRVHHAQGKCIEVRWATPMHLHLDGDACGTVYAVRAEVLPGAITLLNG